MKIKKVLIKNRNKFYWKQGDLHTNFGVIKEIEIQTKTKTKSNKGEEFAILPANFNDNVKKFLRGPQAMMIKDIAPIILRTDINKKSKVLEAGTGSGIMTCYLAKFAKKVISYDIKINHQNLAKQNAKAMQLKNITFKIQDIYKSIRERNIDTIILDLPEPQKALENAFKALKQGGYLVAYLPNMTQVIEFVKHADQKFLVEEVLDVNETKWNVHGRIARPKSPDIMHTAFLIFCRKI